MKMQMKYEPVIDDVKDGIEYNVENNSKNNNGCDGKYNKENNIEYKTDGNIIVNVRLDELWQMESLYTEIQIYILTYPMQVIMSYVLYRTKLWELT